MVFKVSMVVVTHFLIDYINYVLLFMIELFSEGASLLCGLIDGVTVYGDILII